MSESQAKVQMPATENRERIAIIGGGIAGLFCAYFLANDGHEVELFESSDVLGGRIRSFRLNPELLNNLDRLDDKVREPVKDQAILKNALRSDQLTAPITEVEYDKRLWDRLEFNAEFGPMRIELEVQRMLAFLLRRLKIPATNAPPPTEAPTPYDLVRMQRFPAFSSPASAGDPVYDLKPEEVGKNPLELLQLGVCRAVVDLHFDGEGKDSPLKDADGRVVQRYEKFVRTHGKLVEKLGKAAATQRPFAPEFESWLRHQLHEDDYWIIQRYGQIPVLYGAQKYIALHTMGFWNLMAAYLSHNALSKVRDLGTFYHLIPENPNAAEWLTWWMRQFSISSNLEGVFGGMQSVTEKLVNETGIKIEDRSAEIRTTTCDNGGTLAIYRKATVRALTRDESDENRINVKLLNHDNPPKQPFQRVILALPTVPAEKLTQNSNTIWRNVNEQRRFADLLHSALPFQLVKVFFVVRERWWEEEVRANLGATRYPTREVYFWKSRIKESRRGLIMLYTDRPASSFWANYVPNRIQDDIDELCRPKLEDDASHEAKTEFEAVATLRARMKSRFVEYVQENEGIKITTDDIIWCGIMDWGREPYGAASHAWRPNREYWKTLAALADWPLGSDAKGPHLHVCGEAYSDYHAFIEGALRSSVHVLTQIKNKSQGKIDRLASIINILLAGEKEQVDFKKIETCIEHETLAAQGKPVPTPRITDKNLSDDEKYVKDFLDWSEKLDSQPAASQKV